MPRAKYKDVGAAYLTGIMTRMKKGPKANAEALFEIRWTSSKFHSKGHVHEIPKSKAAEGVATYKYLIGADIRPESWDVLCRPHRESQQVDDVDLLDEFEEIEESYVRFEEAPYVPRDVREVEAIKAMVFETNARLTAPSDLYEREDGSSGPMLRELYTPIFQLSASSSFLAYLPLAFWKKVVENTNSYARAQRQAVVTLDDMMKFIGILFYIAPVDKGEYSNYWGVRVEDSILNSGTVGLDRVMSLRRFQYIRKNLSFRHDVTSDDLRQDPAARVRPLLNMLKLRASKFVEPGRNCSVDETSIACRSKYARHLIVFNATKPTGKYHFKVYTCCCASSWLMLSFRLHCTSDMAARLEGVISSGDAALLQSAIELSSEVRKHVVEATRPIHRTNRIVNTDNVYTSCQLLETLRLFGLYGRGTRRENSKHFPKLVMISRKDKVPRDTMRQGVCLQSKIVAASWTDGAVVNIVSNADASTTTTVQRMVGQHKVDFEAPESIIEYNQSMQGVDRLDQLRARFSIADGHTFHKWHKKLAMAFLDMARCNAYITWKLAGGGARERDAHRSFMTQLVSELLNGGWRGTLTDVGSLYGDPVDMGSNLLSTPSRPPRPDNPTQEEPTNASTCMSRSSKQQFPVARAKRECVICRFEGRYTTEVTNFCLDHLVPLCNKTYPIDTSKTYTYQTPNLTCWEKFHAYYFPKGLFNTRGRIRTSSNIYLARKAARQQEVLFSPS